MASNVINRETIRDRLATLIDNALGSGGSGIVEAVYNYRTDDFDGQTPVVCVTSRGSDRRKLTEVSTVRTDIQLYVFIFVLYTDGESWTPALAEDRLDLIEKGVQDVLVDNFHDDGYWTAIGSDLQSQVEPVPVGDELYHRETLFLRAEAYSD
jgi:hypothetical protein